jgi:tRNA pseudouridine38-40 synthase
MEEIETQGVSPLRLAFRVAYLGARFMGSQLQPHLRTVEGEFIAACTRLDLFSDWRQAAFISSGRTDRGVHARGQVVAFTTISPDRAISALNYQLPPDLWCTGYSPVPPDFHPRYDALWRTYRYYFREEGLDINSMKEGATFFTGLHNFSGFAKIGDKNPERRVLSASVFKEGGMIFLEVTAESFLWHMVRSMAASLRDVGTGASDTTLIRDRLEGTYTGGLRPAPPDGLILWEVGYNLSFNPMPVEERRSIKIRDWYGHYRVMSKICSIFDNPAHKTVHEPDVPDTARSHEAVRGRLNMPGPEIRGKND